MKVIFLVVLNLVFLISSAQGHTVSKDHCAKEAFTEEVSNLKCDNKYIKFDSSGLPASPHPMMEGIEATNHSSRPSMTISSKLQETQSKI